MFPAQSKAPRMLSIWMLFIAASLIAQPSGCSSPRGDGRIEPRKMATAMPEKQLLETTGEPTAPSLEAKREPRQYNDFVGIGYLPNPLNITEDQVPEPDSIPFTRPDLVKAYKQYYKQTFFRNANRRGWSFETCCIFFAEKDLHGAMVRGHRDGQRAVNRAKHEASTIHWP